MSFKNLIWVLPGEPRKLQLNLQNLNISLVLFISYKREPLHPSHANPVSAYDLARPSLFIGQI